MENEITKTTKELLEQVDNFEYEIKLIEQLNKQYTDLKSKIKKAMIDVGKANNLEQIKWTTPKGTKITCSIGHTAEIEKQKVQEFDVEILKKEFPEVYEKCLVEKEKNIIVKNATNDTLRITLAKEDEQ